MGLFSTFDEMPDEGMKYAILTYKVVDDDYSDGNTTNPLTWVWKLIIDGISYSYTWSWDPPVFERDDSLEF